MIMDLHRDDATPLYIQIKNHLAGLIEGGLLPAGARLPATRDLAESVGVNRNTVIAAYQELEATGLVSSHVGRGTSVSAHVLAGHAAAVQTREPMRVETLLSATWRNAYPHMPASADQILEAASDPSTISFASNEPDLSLFPVEEFADCTQSALRKYGSDLLASGAPEGFQPLLSWMPGFLARRGIQCTDREVMIVNGIQQGLSIVGRLFIDPGDTVLMENLSYPGALGVFHSLQASCIGIPVDDEGVRVDLMESVLSRRSAKLLYTMPTYHNPTTAVLSPERRERLLALCRERGVMIVEDDYVHELSFDGREVLPLKARDTSDGVISMGSFSEIVFPGIRLSWIVAPAGIIERLRLIKRFTDQYTNRMLQGALLEFSQRGHLEKLLKRKQVAYRKRRDALADAMRQSFPDEVRWQKPRGGLFQWVDLPRGIDALSLLLTTREKGVVFAPDRIFSVEEWERAGLRLSLAGPDEERMNHGIRVIGDALKESLVRRSST
jgi:DNA-binding transcriptional MocR family regulator